MYKAHILFYSYKYKTKSSLKPPQAHTVIKCLLQSAVTWAILSAQLEVCKSTSNICKAGMNAFLIGIPIPKLPFESICTRPGSAYISTEIISSPASGGYVIDGTNEGQLSSPHHFVWIQFRRAHTRLTLQCGSFLFDAIDKKNVRMPKRKQMQKKIVKLQSKKMRKG